MSFFKWLFQHNTLNVSSHNRLKWLCGIIMGDAKSRRREIDYFLTTDRNYLSEMLVLKEMCVLML